MNRRRICALAISAVAAAGVDAQVSPAPAVRAKAIPVHIKYWAFFSDIARLEETAVEVERGGRNGADLRNYYKRQLSPNEVEQDRLRIIGLACNAAVKSQDMRAQEVIRRARANYLEERSKKGSARLEPPAEVQALQAQRDAIINSHIDRLKTEMGSAGFKKVDDYVIQRFVLQSNSKVNLLRGHVRPIHRPSVAVQ